MVSKLQAQLKQTREFESLGQEAYLNLLRTAEVLSRSVTAVLKPAGLTNQQYNVLRILRGARATEEQGLACRDIGERLVTHDSDITRLLDRLESAGLIARERLTEDRRVVLTRITDDGLRVLAELDAPVRELNKSLHAHMSKAQLKQLIELLELMRQPAEQQSI